MQIAVSKDGTNIAYDCAGEGQPVILVEAALGDRSGYAGLAALLAEHFMVVTYDRRGRGDSGDTQPYAPEREIEDIAALIDAVGGEAMLFGSSSGAILALKAAAELGEKVSELVLYDAPIILDESRPPLPEDYVEQLNVAIADGNRGHALEIFFRQAMLLPDEFLAGMKESPMWEGMQTNAHTLAYDGLIVRDVMMGKPWQPGAWKTISAKTLVLAGENSEAFMHGAAKTLADDLAQAEYQSLAGQDHSAPMMAPGALAPLLIAFFAGE